MITVLNTDDAGAGSLRAAIEQANLDAAQDTITFAPSVTGTISLLTALPDLSAGMNMVGPAPSALTVARSGVNGTPLFRIFTVSAGTHVAISGLTIANGVEAGSSSNVGGIGGGIDNSGTLSITDTTISDNMAGVGGSASPGTGGGIYNTGTLSITDTTISGNMAEDANFFGVSPGTGGGIYNPGTLSITNVTFSGNTSGGIANSGSGLLTVVDSTFEGNVVLGSGGGIDNFGTLTVTGSTFSGNTAEGGSGLHIFFSGQGGGIYNNGTASIVNSTLSGNVSEPEAGEPGQGGGIDNSGTLTITFSTVSGNSTGGGMDNDGTVRLTDTIVAGNTSDNGAASDVANTDPGNVTGSYNLIGTGGSGGFSNGQDGNIVLTSLAGLGLSTLGDYGGPTQTTALLPGSPAINAGGAVPGVTTDQRGVSRPQGRAPDIGAFELQLPPEVLEVQRHGVHLQPTTLIVTFSRSMDAASAENLADYRLVSAGPDHRFGTRDDRAVPIRSVQYDTASDTVTILPVHRLRLRQRFQLTILGTPPDGLKDTAGLFLGGARTGQAGSNYVIVITDKLLVPPIVHKARKQAAVAQRLRHR